jgi:putative ABC transport system permease protein
VEIGLLRCTAGADPAVVKQSVRQELPLDVDVYTKDEFVGKERDYWQAYTPIGFVFGLGTALGFIVGLVICYQILSTDVADHVAEYATLKAIGYSNRFLSIVVLQEALWLSVISFILGLAIAGLLYAWLENSTGLPMHLTLGRVELILVLTVVMCAASGILALRKVQAADPAEVF